MKSLTRSLRRPWSRLRSMVAKGGERLGRAARLDRAAGTAPVAMLEQLESRQLMFALTITPELINPATGIGTATAFFAYTLPFFQTTIAVPQPQPPTPVTEDFADEPVGVVDSGEIFAQSNVQVLHTITPGNVRVEGATPEARLMFVQMSNGQELTLRVREGGQNRATEVFQVDIGGLGIDLANIQVTVRRNNTVVGVFTGAALGQLNTTTPGSGVGTFVFSGNTAFPTITEVEFLAINGPNDPFTMDNIHVEVVQTQNAEVVTSRIFGGMIVFSGPVGATVRVLDLYGQEMIQTIILGTPQGAPGPVVDPDDDGVPNNNDGIGAIILTGVNEHSGLTIVGGRIVANIDPNAEFVQGNFSWVLPTNVVGFLSDFEQAGYGYRINPQGNTTSGLPPGPGSIIIGAPWIRNKTSASTYNPYGLPTTGFNFDFNRPGNGIFVQDGSNMGSIFLHGVLHGSSRFNGFLHNMYVGYLAGSISVNGDLGSLVVGSDAGVWEVDPDFPGLIPELRSASTNSQLIVQRTLGEFTVAGRNMMLTTVVGNLNTPVIRPARDVLNYFEREQPYEILRATPDGPRVTFRTLIASNNWLSLAHLNEGTLFDKTGQNPIAGDSFWRNDSILSSEWIGSIGTAVQLHGNIGGGDPIHTADDVIDVYGFAVDGENDVVMEISSGLQGFFALDFPAIDARVVDAQGRVVASSRFDDRATLIGLPTTALGTQAQIVQFTPDMPGAYYLVLIRTGIFPIPSEVIEFNYLVTVGGMASATAGLFGAGASLGHDFLDEFATITMLAGSVGSIRAGGGFVRGDGNEADPIAAYNDEVADIDQRLEIQNVSVSVSLGRLYNITTGGDIEGPAIFTVGLDFGTLVTGLSELIGVGPREGDIGNFTLQVGGRIAMLDIKGAIAVDQDPPGDPDLDIIGPVFITTGTSGGNGDIGMIRVGEHIRAGFLEIVTSPGSTIGAFLVGQDTLTEAPSGAMGIYLGDGIDVITGFGSDVRFADFPLISEQLVANAFTPIFGGQVLSFTDDGGGTVTIEITAVPSGVIAGFVRVLPVDGSQGVAIAQIDADLTGGRALVITSLAPVNQDDVISIGRINITGADAGSAIRILGPGHVDVWQITQRGGDTMGEIINETPLGDIVGIDVAGLNRLVIAGDLGRTQRKAWGPRLMGSFLGLNQGAAGAPLEEIGITGNMAAQWNGDLYRPVDDWDFEPDDAFLSDIGSPLSPYLNGLAVRDGDVADIRVGGSIGDVLVLGGNLVELVVNDDMVTPQGGFNGILGVVYASGDVQLVRIGDGIAHWAHSPFGMTGVFAGDDVLTVTGNLGATPSIISGMIVASNITPADGGGVVNVELPSGGDYFDAYIAAEQLDGWWIGVSPFDSDFQITFYGDIASVSGTNADFFRSRINAQTVFNVTFTGGVWDASFLGARDNIVAVQADHFRNSTLQGQDREFHPNAIIGGEDLTTLSAGLAGAGDISDLKVDLLGHLTGSIAARNINRLDLDVDGTITLVTAGVDLRGSRIAAGTLLALNAARNIRTTDINISGPIVSITAADSITNSNISSNGPDARIDNITAVNMITGTIEAAGPITLVSVTAGDLRAHIRTITARGTVGTLSAARDLDISSDISGDVTLLTAGRGIGVTHGRKVILIRGNLANMTASGAQLYSDVRIGQSLTGTATIGPALSKPTGSTVGTGTITAFGRISNVVIQGDFGGRIVSYSGGIGAVTVNNGSTLPGTLIAAYDGDLTNVVINNGHLLGDLHADHILYFVTVNASADGVFGDIGINPDLNPNTFYDGLRNQLPPGVIADVPIQGPRITAGHNLGRITTSNGSVFEAFIHAGRAIGTLTINGDVRNDPFTAGTGTVIAAGSTMFRVIVAGSMADTIVMAGVKAFGTDGRPGGVGVNADTNQLGRLGSINVSGSGSNVVVTSGFIAGADGIYNTGDDATVPGLSFVANVLFGGPVGNVVVFTDYPIQQVSPGVFVAGTAQPPLDPRIVDGGNIPAGAQQLTAGVGLAFTTLSGESGTMLYTGPGLVFWDAATNRVLLISTNTDSNVTITSNTGSLTNFLVVSNDDASIGLVDINANLLGDSGVVVDHNVVGIEVDNAGGNPQFVAGGNMRSFLIGNMGAGLISARFGRTVTVTGNFGTTTSDGELVARYTALGDMSIGGQHAAAVIVDRDAFSFTVVGAMNRGVFRSGSDLGAFTAGSLSQSRISVRDSIGPVVINGDMFDTSILAGGDLGEDGIPGGTGFNTDQATTGSISSVLIAGSMSESDIVAGMIRGPDGFFGTTDDALAAGRSFIGDVTVAGTVTGSTFLSEQYRIASTGTLGAVTAAGLPVGTVGNFRATALDTAPLPIVVTDLQVINDAGVYEAHLFFNQPMDSSTIAAALLIQEVRAAGTQLIDLSLGAHYTVEYDAATNSAIIAIQQFVTNRNLPQGALPGPGVFRFTLDGAILRAAVVDARLDGDANGAADPTGDNYSSDAVVGDAGDKLVPETVTVPGHAVDFYGPVDLDLVLDNNRLPDGLADINRSYTVRGGIGDHPDHDPDAFGFAGDLDVYKVTLKAGQTLQIGRLEGAALFTLVSLYNAAGQLQFGDTADSLVVASNFADPGELTVGANYLIKTTGVFYVVVGNVPGSFQAPGFIPDIPPIPGAVGDYRFDVRVFDDADSGFSGDTDSGDGTNMPTPPTPIVFAGPDLTFGTPDDLPVFQTGGFFFGHDRGPDGIPNNEDDIVTGSNSAGITITRAGGRITTTVESSIGTPGHVGVPGDVLEPDVDVYHLNDGLAIVPGTRFRITIRLAEHGADLGSRDQKLLVNWNPEAEFAIFETTNSSTVSDGLLVFAPNDFKSAGGTPGAIASLAPFEYGYDENGDFYVNFIAPGALGTAGAPAAASYAVYLQGVFNTDYTLEIVQEGSGSFVRPRQNIFIETRGGNVDWLEVGGLVTNIGAFNVASLGFSGSVAGQPVQTYVLNQLVARLTAAFNAAGVDVVISTDPNAFEFQDFSTVFLSSSFDPIRYFNERNYGAAEHSDPFNTDRNDEAVVFAPSFGLLGFTPSQIDVNRFVDSLTAGVGRRIGELVGLRQTDDLATLGGDIMASNSPEAFGGPFSFQTTPRSLASRFSLNGRDGGFMLGQQASIPLLQMLLRP